MTSHILFQHASALADIQKSHPEITHFLGEDHNIYGYQNGIFRLIGPFNHEECYQASNTPKRMTLEIELAVFQKDKTQKIEHYEVHSLKGSFTRMDAHIILSALLKNDTIHPEDFDLGFSPSQNKDDHEKEIRALINLNFIEALPEQEDSMEKDEFMQHCKRIIAKQ